MPGSQTLGVRIPEHVLAGVDRFARAQELTRSRAIAMLVEQALSESGTKFGDDTGIDGRGCIREAEHGVRAARSAMGDSKPRGRLPRRSELKG